MSDQLPIDQPSPTPDTLYYVIVQRHVPVPPQPYYSSLADGVAALDQIRRENPAAAEHIVLMAVAPNPGQGSGSSALTPTPAEGTSGGSSDPVELVTHEVQV